MSAAFVLRPRAAVDPAAWDALVDASDDAWLWHRHAFGDALATWPGSTDESFALADADGGLVAVVPARRVAWRRARVLRLARWESLGGPAIAARLEGSERARVRDAAVDALRDRLAGGDELVVTLPPMAPALRGERCPRVNPLLDAGLDNALTQTWVVDLRPGEQAAWGGMKSRARRAVRAAEKAGVTIRPARPDDLSAYVVMHEANYVRTGAVPHPREYFAAIWRDFLPTGRARIFVAEHDGTIVGARNFGVDKRAALYWTGASTERGLELHANHLLQWEAMRALCADGVAWAESGEAFPAARGDKSAGLSYFKASFGGELYPYYRGRTSRRGAPALAAEALDLVRALPGALRS